MSFDRSRIPQPNEEIQFKLPEIRNFTLSNGLKVSFVEKNFLPILRMNLIINSGSIFDPVNMKGLANLTCMMIDEGAGPFNALELNEEFDILGSSFNSSCNHDNIFLSIRTLSESFERSLELLSLIIHNPHFNDPDFQRERRKIEVKLLQQNDEPEELAYLAFAHLIHGKNNRYSYPILGYNDSIYAISVKEIKEFHNNLFTPDNSHLIVVGNIEQTKLVELLENYFKNWKQKSDVNSLTFELSKSKRNISILDKAGAVQTEIRVGHRSSSRKAPDFFPRTIMNNILGGQFTSRINLNLREKKGFTYGATSNFAYFKNSGEFCVSTSVSTENTRAAVHEILNDLEGIKTGVTSEELDFTKSSLIRRFPSQFESDYQVASNLSLLAVHNLPQDYFDNYLENIRNTTIQQVNKAAIDNINLNELSVVLVGDSKKLMNDFDSMQNWEVQLINQRGKKIG